jgi:hypothetical protein
VALTFATGFEYGITPVITGLALADAVNTGGTFTFAIDTSPVRTGTYSLNCAATGTDVSNFANMRKLLGSGGIAVARIYININTLPASGESTIAQMQEGSGVSWGLITVDSGGVLRAKVEAGTAQTFSSVTTGVWYRLDLRYDTSGATWALDWQVDGVAQTQATEGSHSASTGAKSLILGVENSANTTCNVNYDDVAASITTGDYPIGAGKVLYAPLNGTAAHVSITTTQWDTTSDFSSFANFTGVNETVSAPLLVPPISTGTPSGFRMNAATIAGNGRWPIDAPAGAPTDNAQLVAAIIAVREASAGTNNAVFRTELGGSTTDIFASANPGWGTTWNYLAAFMSTGPGAATWTSANVEAMQFECDSTDAAPAIWCQGVVYEVAYPETGGNPDPYIGGGEWF